MQSLLRSIKPNLNKFKSSMFFPGKQNECPLYWGLGTD